MEGGKEGEGATLEEGRAGGFVPAGGGRGIQAGGCRQAGWRAGVGRERGRETERGVFVCVVGGGVGSGGGPWPQAWGRVAKVLRAEFVPYLNIVMPPLLQEITRYIYIYIYIYRVLPQ